MERSIGRRVRGLAFLLSGLVAVGLVGYLALVPGSLSSLHPLPLVLLLLLTAGVALWQAWTLLS